MINYRLVWIVALQCSVLSSVHDDILVSTSVLSASLNKLSDPIRSMETDRAIRINRSWPGCKILSGVSGWPIIRIARLLTLNNTNSAGKVIPSTWFTFTFQTSAKKNKQFSGHWPFWNDIWKYIRVWNLWKFAQPSNGTKFCWIRWKLAKYYWLLL